MLSIHGTMASGRYIDMEKERRNKKALLDKVDSTVADTAKADTAKDVSKGSVQEKLMNEDSKRGKLFRQAIESKKAEKQPRKEDAK